MPAFGVLIVSRWNADGTVDNGFARQEAGRDPNLDYWPRGVLPLSGTEALVFGEAGAVEPETHSIGGLTFNIEVKRRPEPALFRITYPAGFDEVFGARGVDRMPLQDFEALALAARVLPPVGRTGERRVRYVCADLRSQKKGISSDVREPVSNFGGIGQFTFGRIRPRPVP